MPRINLLPVRAARQADLARTELLAFGGALVAVCAALFLWYQLTASEIDAAHGHIDQLQKEIAEIDKTVTRVEEFKKKTQVLERKLAVIDQLKRQKLGPAKMLADLADIFTKQPKTWLVSIEEHDGMMTLKGAAMDQENISEFQIALEQQSKFFRDVKLGVVSSTREGGIDFFHWTLTCRANYAAT